MTGTSTSNTLLNLPPMVARRGSSALFQSAGARLVPIHQGCSESSPPLQQFDPRPEGFRAAIDAGARQIPHKPLVQLPDTESQPTATPQRHDFAARGNL